MTPFTENIKQAFSESQYYLCTEHHKTDYEWQKLNKQYSQVFNEIRNRLGKHRKLMLKLELLQNEMVAIDDEYIYLQGMADSVTLLKLIKLI